MSDIPLGFGVTARSTDECRALDPGAIVAFHQSDVGGFNARPKVHVMRLLKLTFSAGEYLRAEDDL